MGVFLMDSLAHIFADCSVNDTEDCDFKDYIYRDKDKNN
jgi:hypothetical protein